MKLIWELVPSVVKAILSLAITLLTVGWGAVITQKMLAHSEAQAAVKPIVERMNGLDKRQDDLIKTMDTRMNSMDEKLNILIQRDK